MLCCPDSKSPKFVISRNVIFDENFILQPRKESLVDSTCLEEEANWILSTKLQKECRRVHMLN